MVLDWSFDRGIISRINAVFHMDVLLQRLHQGCNSAWLDPGAISNGNKQVGNGAGMLFYNGSTEIIDFVCQF